MTQSGWNSFFTGEGEASFNKLYNEFYKYFIEHQQYNAAFANVKDLSSVVSEENKAEKGDAINLLAEKLVSNLMDLEEPAIQTNALLAQILVMVRAIKNQTDDNNLGTESNPLAETLSALAMGITGRSSNSTTNPTTST